MDHAIGTAVGRSSEHNDVFFGSSVDGLVYIYVSSWEAERHRDDVDPPFIRCMGDGLD